VVEIRAQFARCRIHCRSGELISARQQWFGQVTRRRSNESIARQPAIGHFGLESSVRPSLAFYNTLEEVDALVLALRSLKRSR